MNTYNSNDPNTAINVVRHVMFAVQYVRTGPEDCRHETNFIGLSATNHERGEPARLASNQDRNLA